MNLIDQLKQNDKPFAEMSPELQAKAKEIGPDEFEWMFPNDPDAVWEQHNRSFCDPKFCIYRLKQTYNEPCGSETITLEQEQDMNNPMYVPVKKTQDYKVTAVETIYKKHDGTNTVLEITEKVIYDEALFPATSEALASYYAMKDIDEAGEVDMTNLKVTCRPFCG